MARETINAPVAPVTTVINVTQVRIGTVDWIMLQVATPTGLFVCFIEPKAARELATGLELLGAAAETGLILASS